MREYTSLALSTLAVNWTLTFLAFMAVTAMYCHRLVGLSMSVRTDDILILVSFVVGVVLVSLSTWTILDEGQAEHQENVPGSQLELAAKSILVAEALWTLVTGLLRIAACLLAHSSFSLSRFARRTAIVIMALSASLAAASTIQIFLICRPFAAQWDPRVLGACGDQIASFMALESVGVVLDLGILLVPSVMIMGLQMRLETKIQLILVFNIGAIVLVVTGLRMAALRNAVSPDFTYSQSYLSLLSASGCMTGIICCASPSIWAMIKRNCHGRHLRWRDQVKALQVYVSGPTFGNTRGTRATRTQPGQEDGGDNNDVEKGSNASTDADTAQRRFSWETGGLTGFSLDSLYDAEVVDSSVDEDVVERSSTEEVATIGGKRFLPAGDKLNDGGVALSDFHCTQDNELPLTQGQLVWIHHSVGQGWLLAENMTTNEIGLVPETFVQLRNWGSLNWDTKTEVSNSLRCLALSLRLSRAP